MKKHLVPFLAGLFFITPLMLFPAAIFSHSSLGGKHFIGMTFIFPYLMLLGSYDPDTLWLLLLLFLQFPLYAVALQAAWGKEGFRWRLLCLVLFHAFAVVTSFDVEARLENREMRRLLQEKLGPCETMHCP